MAKTLGDITRELNEKVLAPAKAEAEGLVRGAGEQAASIVAEAEAEAAGIKKAALAEAENTRKQLQVDMDTAARNFIVLVQEKLESAVVVPVVESRIQEALGDNDFLKKIIEVLLTEFVKGGSQEHRLEVLLPENKQAELEAWFKERFKEKLGDSLNVQFTDKISFGLLLGESGRGAHFNFSNGLVEAFSNFCSPRFRKHFFRS